MSLGDLFVQLGVVGDAKEIDDVIKKAEKQLKLTQEQIKELSNTLEELLGEDTPEDGTLQQFLTLLSMDEENFKVLAPGIVQSFKQTLNNPNDKLGLVQALNASGSKAEDLLEVFIPLTEEIDQITGISSRKKDFLKEIIATLINAIQETEGIALQKPICLLYINV